MFVSDLLLQETPHSMENNSNPNDSGFTNELRKGPWYPLD